MTKTRPFLSTCYGYPSTTEVPPCCQAATKKLTFSTTSVLLLLNVPLSLSRGTVFRRPKNPRRGYRPKIAGILFVCNEPEGKYYTVPSCHKALGALVTLQQAVIVGVAIEEFTSISFPTLPSNELAGLTVGLGYCM